MFSAPGDGRKMSNILSDFVRYKNYESADEYLMEIKSKGYEIPSGTALDDSLNVAFPIDKKLGEAYFIEKYHALPRDFAEQNIDTLMSESEIMGVCLNAFFRMPNPKPLYLITKDAVSVIQTTRLTGSIGQDFCREYLQTPVFIYSGEGFTLFDDVVALILFTDDEGYMTCVIEFTDGRYLVQNVDLRNGAKEVSPVFHDDGGEEYVLENGFVINRSSKEMAHSAIVYIAKFILLLNSDKQPILVEPLHKTKANSTPEKEKKIFGNISYKKISLTHEYKTKLGDDRKGGSHVALDREGKTLRVVKVTGHIRMQAYGPGWTKHRPIYIEAHESRAWKKDGIQLVKVVE